MHTYIRTHIHKHARVHTHVSAHGNTYMYIRTYISHKEKCIKVSAETTKQMEHRKNDKTGDK